MRAWIVQDIIATIVDPAYFAVPEIGAASDTISGMLSDRYGDMLLYTVTDDLSIASTEFMRKWALFKSAYLSQYAKIYTALTAAYDPLENYNRTENRAGYMDVPEYTDTDTSTPQIKTKTTVHRGKFETTDDVSTYDAQAKNVSKTTSGHATGVTGDTTETEYVPADDGTALSDKIDRKHGAHKDRHFEQLTVSGNIGVTSSQDMLKQEIEVRQYSLIEDFCARFALLNFNTNIFRGCTL